MDIPKLTPAEMTNLWNSYLINTMTQWVTRYFIANCQDEDLRSILEYAEEMATTEVQKSRTFLEEANHPLPQKFDAEDVDVNAPALFTDKFVLILKGVLCQESLGVYSLSLSTSTRTDIRQFYEDCLKNASQLFNRLADLMIKKGLHHPEIHIPTPELVEKVSKQNFLAGWFTERRPLTSYEITQLVANIRINEVTKEFMRGFAQVTRSNEFKNHFHRGAEIRQKHIEIFQSILFANELPQLPTWESEVTDTTVPPFSDRLMLFKMTLLTGATAGHYGVSLSSVLRKDIGAHYTRLMAEELLYGEDCVNLMIEHQFLDQLPMAKERK